MLDQINWANKNNIGERFELLTLKDEKVKYSNIETNNDVLILHDLVKQECADFCAQNYQSGIKVYATFLLCL